ncbi:MAG: ATP-dependent Clp protease ATP-binding subunit [Candidatus Moranbacteria bacterium]|nr:ATP-dependent Clp protease ATP-binding subunit [Candidatus Moranbacteria bacterium]
MNNVILRYFTEHLKNTLNRAQKCAFTRGNSSAKVEVIDLFNALAQERGGVGSVLINQLSVLRSKSRVSKKIGRKAQGSIPFSQAVHKIIIGAVRAAQQFQFPYVGTEHLLFSILENPGEEVNFLLSKNQTEYKKLIDQVKVILSKEEISLKDPFFFAEKIENKTKNGVNESLSETESQKEQNFYRDILGEVSELFNSLLNEKQKREQNDNSFHFDRFHNRPAFGIVMPSQPQYQQKNIRLLDYFARDINKEVAEGLIEPVIGREEEIERAIRILMRKTKNNPVFIGEPGVGKTAIVAGIAFRLLERNVPYNLVGKKIMNLDVGLLVAGTAFRGEFEERFKRVIEEAEKDSSVILFIDELHNIVGAGSAQGSLDAANIVKPALARGLLRCIGATTSEEYQQYIEKDGALERRFQPVWVKETDPLETERILRGIKNHYENYHRVKIPPRTIKKIVTLASQYITDRYLPDKAIDLLDEAAAYVVQEEHSRGAISHLQRLEAQKEKLIRLKEQAVDANNFKLIEPLIQNEKDLNLAIKSLEKDVLKEAKTVPVVREKDVAKVLGKKLNIPVELFLEDTKERLNRLPKKLKAQIKGQNQAVARVCKSLKRKLAGVVDFDRPATSFLFVGPTGVGKTYLAKLLATEIFLRPDSLIRVDMSEFSEKHTLSRLLGSPPGYVGYGDRNNFSDQVRKNPYSLVLFDEIEKAHPEVFHVLLQVLEDGFLTDGTGKKVNFRNTIIVFTTNLGSGEFNKKTLGFGEKEVSGSFKKGKSRKVRKWLEEFLQPEFISRLTDIVFFGALKEGDLKEIAQLDIQKLKKRLSQTNKIKLKTGKSLPAFLAKRGIDREEGARAIRQLVQTKIEEPIAQMVLDNKLRRGSEAGVHLRQEGVRINLIEKKPNNGGRNNKKSKRKNK